MSTVLVVDDDAQICAMLAMMLGDVGHRSIISVSGRYAIELATEHRPDLAVLDVELPDTDGFTVCRALKANPHTMDIPVLFLTGHDHLPSKLEGFARGAVDYMTKPFEMAELTARVRTLLAHRERQIALAAENLRLRDALASLTLGEQMGISTSPHVIPEIASEQPLLSVREQQVYQLIGRRYGDKQIAAALNIRIGSVKTYVARLKAKLGLETRQEVMAHYEQSSRR